MPGIHAFVPENAADLEDTLHAADDQSLQVELQGNAELDVLVQSVEMGLEGTGRGAACVGDQHGGLDFDEVSACQEVPDLADDLGSLIESDPGLIVHDQVHITLSVAHVCIHQSVEFLRKGAQGLGQEGDLLAVDADLTGLCLENKSLYADDIADVQLLEGVVGFFAQVVSGGIDLDPAVPVLDISEGSFAHLALEHHAACQGNVFSFELLEVVSDLGCVVGLVILYDLEGVLSRGLQLCKLVASDLFQLRNILSLIIILCHALSYILS